MLTQATIDKMHAMKMHAMAEAMERQVASSEYSPLVFEERVGMMVDSEWNAREQRKLTRRLRLAKLRYPASVEDIDYGTPRGLDRQVVLSLVSCAWITEKQNLLIVGPTGTGKSYLACAFSERACRAGYSAAYFRTPRLLQELAVARGDGSYGRFLSRLAKTDLLALDDWLLAPLKDSERRDVLEVIEDRIATQLPITAWHGLIGDRLVHRAHKITLKGPSMREVRTKGKTDKPERP